jgi:hypothetical protein
MGRGLPLALVLAAFCSLPAVARGQGEFPLEYRPFQQSLPAEFYAAQDFLPALPGAPAGLKMPKLKGAAVYFSRSMGGREIVLLIERGKTPKLYVDTDGDKDMGEEKAVEGAVAKRNVGLLEALVGGGGGTGEVTFGPVTVPGQAPGGDIQFRIRSLPGDDSFQFVFIEPAGVRGGVVDMAGRKHVLRVLDANLDGRYDGVVDPAKPDGFDWCALAPAGSAGRTSGEPQPLPRIVKVGEDWYSLQLKADGSSVALGEFEPVFGTLDAGPAVAGLMLLSDTGLHRLTKTEGGWQLPEGRYSARQVSLKSTDDKGRTWEMSAYGETGKLADFAIRGGETLAVQAGPPLTVKTDVTVYGTPPQAQLALLVVGQAGEEYAPGATRDGETVPAPTYKIYDEEGKELSSGRFEYG